MSAERQSAGTTAAGGTLKDRHKGKAERPKPLRSACCSIRADMQDAMQDPTARSTRPRHGDRKPAKPLPAQEAKQEALHGTAPNNHRTSGSFGTDDTGKANAGICCQDVAVKVVAVSSQNPQTILAQILISFVHIAPWHALEGKAFISCQEALTKSTPKQRSRRYSQQRHRVRNSGWTTEIFRP